MKKIALVTGANKGIGKAIASELARQGFSVIIGARSIDEGKAVAAELRGVGDTDIMAVQLDVTDQTSAETARAVIERTYGRLDVLVNNAGVILDQGPEISTQRFVDTYAVNVFGVVRMIETMLPLLEKSADARIVNLSSGLGSLTYTQDPANRYSTIVKPAYNTSKTAVNALTIQCAKVLKDKNIVVNAVDPGRTSTDMTNHAADAKSPEQPAAEIVKIITSTSRDSGNIYADGQKAAW